MSAFTLGNNQSATITNGELNGDSLQFYGTQAAAVPKATFAGGVNGLANTFTSGTATTPEYGAMGLQNGAAVSMDGLKVSHATLSVAEQSGSTVTFMGPSSVANGSTLTITGQGTASVNMAGPIIVDGTSTVTATSVNITGNGMFLLTGNNAQLNVGSVANTDTVTLNGGVLNLASGMTFLGTITNSYPNTSRIGAGTVVRVDNAAAAVRETFNETTGMLNLFNAQGTQLAKLKFAGTGDVYATPVAGAGYMSLSMTHAANSLQIAITH